MICYQILDYSLGVVLTMSKMLKMTQSLDNSKSHMVWCVMACNPSNYKDFLSPCYNFFFFYARLTSLPLFAPIIFGCCASKVTTDDIKSLSHSINPFSLYIDRITSAVKWVPKISSKMNYYCYHCYGYIYY